MGIIKKQGIAGTIAIYLGIVIGAFNTIFLFPYVFPENSEYMGLVNLVISYSVVAGSFIGLGLPNGIVYFFAKFTNRQKESLFGFTMLVSAIPLLLLLVLFISAPTSIADIITDEPEASQPYLPHLYLMILLYTVFETLTSIMQSYRLVVFPNALKDVGRKLAITLLLVAVSAGLITGIYQFMTYLVLLYVLMLVWLLVIFLKKVKLKLSFNFSIFNTKEVTIYSAAIFLSAVIFILVSRIDVMMLGSMMETTKEVALYLIAYQIGSVVGTPSRALNRALKPVFAQHYVDMKLNELRKVYKQAALNQFLISGFIALVIVFNLDLLYLVLPTEYHFGKGIVYFIISGFLFSSYLGPNGPALSVSRYFKYDSFINLSILVMVVVLNLVFIPKYGALGAAASTAIVTIFNNIVKSILLKLFFGIPLLFKRIFYVLLFFSLLVLIHFLLPINQVILSSVVYTFGLIFAFAVFVLFTNITPDFKVTFQRLLGKVWFREL